MSLTAMPETASFVAHLRLSHMSHFHENHMNFAFSVSSVISSGEIGRILKETLFRKFDTYCCHDS